MTQFKSTKLQKYNVDIFACQHKKNLQNLSNSLSYLIKLAAFCCSRGILITLAKGIVQTQITYKEKVSGMPNNNRIFKHQDQFLILYTNLKNLLKKIWTTVKLFSSNKSVDKALKFQPSLWPTMASLALEKNDSTVLLLNLEFCSRNLLNEVCLSGG